ncbi:MAG TPA: hypothetical protein VM120_01230 [Bryobacteraceae bacterium]|nr:hypothetical protein [Bryobacteraceae bacterium]
MNISEVLRSGPAGEAAHLEKSFSERAEAWRRHLKTIALIADQAANSPDPDKVFDGVDTLICAIRGLEDGRLQERGMEAEWREAWRDLLIQSSPFTTEEVAAFFRAGRHKNLRLVVEEDPDDQ